jgi:hypothetical protein
MQCSSASNEYFGIFTRCIIKAKVYKLNSIFEQKINGGEINEN